MKPRRLVFLIIALSVLAWGVWWYRQITNPYAADGLQVEWVFGGATSTVPGLDVWVDYNGTRITPDFLFGAINSPSLRIVITTVMGGVTLFSETTESNRSSASNQPRPRHHQFSPHCEMTSHGPNPTIQLTAMSHELWVSLDHVPGSWLQLISRR